MNNISGTNRPDMQSPGPINVGINKMKLDKGLKSNIIQSKIKGVIFRFFGMAVKLETDQGRVYIPTNKAKSWLRSQGHNTPNRSAKNIESILASIVRLKQSNKGSAPPLDQPPPLPAGYSPSSATAPPPPQDDIGLPPLKRELEARESTKKSIHELFKGGFDSNHYQLVIKKGQVEFVEKESSVPAAQGTSQQTAKEAIDLVKRASLYEFLDEESMTSLNNLKNFLSSHLKDAFSNYPDLKAEFDQTFNEILNPSEEKNQEKINKLRDLMGNKTRTEQTKMAGSPTPPPPQDDIGLPPFKRELEARESTKKAIHELFKGGFDSNHYQLVIKKGQVEFVEKESSAPAAQGTSQQTAKEAIDLVKRASLYEFLDEESVTSLNKLKDFLSSHLKDAFSDYPDLKAEFDQTFNEILNPSEEKNQEKINKLRDLMDKKTMTE